MSNYSLSYKTVNTRDNFWNVYCFVTNQKPDETAKDNWQTAACISHDLIPNNELAFSSSELAYLPQLTFKNQTTEFGIDLKYRLKITNHSQLAWPFELHVKHRGSDWFVIFCSEMRCLALSDPIDSTLLSRNMSLNISFISILCIWIWWIARRTISVFENSKIEDLSWKKSQLIVSNQGTDPLCGLTVIFCGSISHLIGCETIKIQKFSLVFTVLWGRFRGSKTGYQSTPKTLYQKLSIFFLPYRACLCKHLNHVLTAE